MWECEIAWSVFTELLKYLMLFIIMGILFQALTLSCQSFWILIFVCFSTFPFMINETYLKKKSTQGKLSHIL